MGNSRNTGYLGNVIKVSDTGNISFVSGSTVLMSVSSSGAVSSSATTVSSSIDDLIVNNNAVLGSSESSTVSIPAFIASDLYPIADTYKLGSPANYWTRAYVQTGSFNEVNVTGRITAQTLVVQTITSSVDFVTGSTRFGSLLTNTHVFSGSVTMNPGGLFVSSSGLVGIGTTTPNEVLEVFSPEVAGTSQQTRLRITQAASVSSRVNLVSGVISGSNPYFSIEARQASSPFAIVERLRIDGDGNVGIGTTTPSYRLHVSGAFSSNPGFYVYGTTYGMVGVDRGSSASSAGVNYYTTGSQRWFTGIYENTNNFGFYNALSANFPMVITTGSNVGIGTTSPNYKLEVNGSIRAGSGNSSALLVAATGTASTQAAIAIQQLTAEGDTLIFADFEPYANYGIVAKNDVDSIDFNAGNTTNNLTSYNIVNRSGTTVPAYVKTRIDLTNGYLYVGGRVGIGTISPGVSLDLGSKTDAVRLTNGTTAQRPSAAAGQIRYNTSFNFLEYYDGSNWVPVVGQTSPGASASNPAESANEIKNYNPNATNGLYWIRQVGTVPVQAYCVFTDYNGSAIQGGPWTVPLISNDANTNFSDNGPTAAAQFLSKCQAIGIASPGRGMENTRTTTEVYGAWLAVKRALWNNYSTFITNGTTGGGAVLRMPMININGAGGTSDQRLVYNTSLGTHLPPNIDGDACNASQLFCGWWAGTDISGWRVNDNAIPGPEDWNPSDTVNSSYSGNGIQSALTICVYK